MQDVHLFQLASRHADFHAIRQQVVAANVANADTPGYRAQDVVPFKEVLDSTTMTMHRTSPGHLKISGREALKAEAIDGKSWETTHSENNVSPEQELLKASEISRNMTLNARLTKTFHRLYMSTVRTA